MAERSLPDLKTRVRVDRSQLDALPASAKKTGAALKEHLGTSTTHAKSLEKQIGKVADALGHLGPAGQVAGSALSNVSSSAASVTGALGLAGGVGVAALAAIAGAAMYAEGSYEKLVAKIDNYQDVTGSTAAQSSRMVHTLDVLGVSSETASAAMFKLSRAVGEHPDKLQALGVEIKKDAAGNTDLTETLYSVSDAYNAAGDSSQKTAILFAAFGKGGADMIDIVEQGSARLRQLATDTKLVLTDDDIRRAREYKIHQAEIKAGWEEWWGALGQKVQPALDAVQESMLRGNNLQDRLNQLLKEGKITHQQWSDAMQGNTVAGRALVATIDKEYDASKKIQHQMALHNLTIQEQADLNKKLVDSMDLVINTQLAAIRAGSALDRANIALKDSALRVDQAVWAQVDATHAVTTATETLHEAIRIYGKNSEQAKTAAEDLTKAQMGQRAVADDVAKAQLDQRDAYLAVAEAARQLVIAQETASGGARNAGAEAKAYVGKLEELAGTLAPDSALRKNLQAYINKLKDEVPPEVATQIYATYHMSALVEKRHAIGDVGFEGGGRPPVGRDVWVGEGGPERVRFDQPATIYPSGQRPPPSAGGGDMSETNALLRDLISAVTAEPTGQTGIEAALYKAVQLAAVNRNRGMVGA